MRNFFAFVETKIDSLKKRALVHPKKRPPVYELETVYPRNNEENAHAYTVGVD